MEIDGRSCVTVLVLLAVVFFAIYGLYRALAG
jgi:hypothetical protein